MTIFHFLNVGCGNMTLLQFPDGTVFLYDCNVTESNKREVLAYLAKILGRNVAIKVFVNSHRDADHMRGLEIVHRSHPIQKVWDSGVEGTSTNTPEYGTYMRLRREIGYFEVQSRKLWTYGEARLRCLNSQDDEFSDANDQSIVFKVEYKGFSVLLGGDTTFRPWKEKILPFYGNDVKSSIFLAPHHGSLSFFDDPSDEKHYYMQHIKAIAPSMTIVSVGPNVHGLPDDKALEFYTKYSSGSDKGNKVFTTEQQGNIRLALKQEGGWSLSGNQ